MFQQYNLCRLIILFGFHGVGKTTTVLRLAEMYTNQGAKVCVLPADFYKPLSQFDDLKKNSNINIISDSTNKYLCYSIKFKRLLDLVSIEKYNFIIIDTPGCWRDRKSIINMFDLPLKYLRDLNVDEKFYVIVEKLDDQENANIYKEYREAIKEINCEIITHDDVFDIKMI